MAYRYLIYSTGTTYATTIVRESATNNPGVNEASLYTDFVIPEIQPLYLWRVTGGVNVVPNTDANISEYVDSIAPAPTPDDSITYGEVTGITANKIDKVTGATGKVPIFTAGGGLQSSGYDIGQLTGGTDLTFVGSGGTQVFVNGSVVTVYSTVPSGTTIAWTDVSAKPAWLTGTTIQQFEAGHKHDQYVTNAVYSGFTASTYQEFQNVYDDIDYVSGITNTKLNISTFTGYTASTGGAINSKLDKAVFTGYTATTQPILNAALTGATTNGTGTTLITSVSNRKVTLKTISAVGGVTLLGDSNNLIISGQTNASVSFAEITGPVSGNTNLQQALDKKLNISTFTGYTASTGSALNKKLDIAVFTGYTATTSQRLQGIESDIDYISGQTLTKSVFGQYTGTTQPILNAALTGATNGLSVGANRKVELGGNLTKDTIIGGTSFGLTANTKNIHLQAINGISIIDTDGAGGINIESDAGTISLVGNTNLSAERTKLEISQTGIVMTDSRVTKTGIIYAGDYSTTFTDESLITKRYADAIAAGLVPKEAVRVATTGAITLSGLTTIDGIALANGDRVLVKNQASAINNGIYVASGSTWARATDFDDIPSVEVVSGNIVPVITGNTNHNTLWVLITPNPVQVGIDPLNFTLFSSPSFSAGHGIGITGSTVYVKGQDLDGNSILWSGGTFNVDVNSGGLQSALAGKEATITGAATTITTANLTVDRAVISNGTGKIAVSPVTSVELSYLTGTTSNIQLQFNGKQATITGAATTITTANLTASRVLVSDGSGKVAVGNVTSTELNYLTGTTSNIQNQLNSKLAIATFTGYSASTQTNQIQLIHTGGTDINTVIATGIVWHSISHSGNSFTWTGGTDIKINKTADYEVSYHIPHGHSGTNNVRGIGSNLVLNGATILNNTAGASGTARAGIIGNLVLPNTILSLASGDVLDLVAFRTGLAGISNTVVNGVILIKEKNKLQ